MASRVEVLIAARNLASRDIKRVKDDVRDIGTQADTAERKARGLGRSLSSVGSAGGRGGKMAMTAGLVGLTGGIAGVGLAAAAAFPLLKDGVNIAADVGESMSKNTVVFGDHAKAVDAFSKTTADSLGLARGEALNYAGSLGAVFKNSGFTAKASADMGVELIKRSADMASFNNVAGGSAGVLQAMQSALAGETEPLRAMGVYLSADAIAAEAMSSGLAKTTVNTVALQKAQLTAERAQAAYNVAVKEHGEGSLEARTAQNALAAAQDSVKKALGGTKVELTNAQKQQATYNLIMRQSQMAAGDFANTSGGLANQQRILSARVTDLKGNIGQGLLPVVLSVVTALNNNLFPAFNTISRVLGPVITAFKGIVSTAVQFEDGISAMDSVRNLPALFQPVGTALVFLSRNFWHVSNIVRDFVRVFRAEGFSAALSQTANSLRFWGQEIAAIAQQAIGGLWGFIQPRLTVLIGSVANWFSNTAIPWVRGHINAFSWYWSAWIGPLIGEWLGKLGNLISRVATWFNEVAAPLIRERTAALGVALVNWIEPRIIPALNMLGNFIGRAGDWLIGVAVPRISAHMAVMGQQLEAWIGPRIQPAINHLGTFLLRMSTWARETALPAIGRRVAEWGGAIIGWVVPRIPGWLAAAGKFLAAALVWMRDVGGAAFRKEAQKWGAALLDWLRTTAIPAISARFGEFDTAVGTWITDTALPAMIGYGKSLGSNMMDGLVNWLTGSAASVKAKLTDALKSIMPDIDLNPFGGQDPLRHDFGPGPGPTGTMGNNPLGPGAYVSGYRPGESTFYGTNHEGIDINTSAAHEGARSMISGVAQVIWDKFGQQAGVWVRNASGIAEKYYHIRPSVQTGQTVRAGQVLGHTAMVGDFISGEHLHWARYRNGSLLGAGAYGLGGQKRHSGGPIAPNRQYIVKQDESVVLTGKGGQGYVQPHNKPGAWAASAGGTEPMIVLAGPEIRQWLQSLANPRPSAHVAIRTLAGRWD